MPFLSRHWLHLLIAVATALCAFDALRAEDPSHAGRLGNCQATARSGKAFHDHSPARPDLSHRCFDQHASSARPLLAWL